MRILFAILAIGALVALLQWPVSGLHSENAFHSAEELEWYRHAMRSLPDTTNALFIGSGACVDCHGSDPEGIASVIGEGVDINVVDDWRATMMANSAKDPFWRAKVSHEVIVNPQLQEEIETTCTACHAPMGHFNAMYLGESHYSMAQLATDSLGLDGVSCVSCHQQSADGLGQFFSGQLFFDTTRVAYGPYLSPLVSPMAEATGYIPEYGEHINDAGLCAGCHTLLTSTVDLEGNLTGNSFVEQATYHEWLNSVYNEETSCQGCHVPRVDGPVQIAAGYDTEPRSPFGLHYFVGGNTYMVELMRDNRVDLGIDATAEQFDSVLARTTRLLRQQTLEMELDLLSRDADTAYYELSLSNLAGHKFPSGYPARLAFVEFIVTDETGDTLFASGLLDDNYRIIGRDPEFEPHHDVIRAEDEVQIYEFVMLDVAGNVTTVLERADITAKDNRIPPIGFTEFHPVYDTTRVYGFAESDLNFNKAGKAQGTGADLVRYHIPLDGYQGSITAYAAVQYQALPPRWMDEMFAETSPEIDYFEALYGAQAPIPLQVVEDSLFNGPTGLNPDIEATSVRAWIGEGQLFFDGDGAIIEHIRMFNMRGQQVFEAQPLRTRGELRIDLPTGIYVVHLATGNRDTVLKRFVP